MFLLLRAPSFLLANTPFLFKGSISLILKYQENNRLELRFLNDKIVLAMYSCACNIRWSVNVYICIKVAYREGGEKGLWWKSEVICLLAFSRFQAGSDLTWFVGVPLTFATQMNTNFYILTFIRWIFGISFSVSLSLSLSFFFIPF